MQSNWLCFFKSDLRDTKYEIRDTNFGTVFEDFCEFMKNFVHF